MKANEKPKQVMTQIEMNDWNLRLGYMQERYCSYAQWMLWKMGQA